MLKIKSSVTKPAAAVEQCQVKSRKKTVRLHGKKLQNATKYFTQINDVLTVLSGVVTTDNGVIYR